MTRLDGKVALITGAARGMGAMAARILAGAGAKVVLSDILQDEGERSAAELGADAIFLAHDVANEASWKTVLSEAIRRFGRLDILVNNAGIHLAGPIEATTLDDFMRSVMVNQTSVFLGMRESLPALKSVKDGKQGGSIVNISSIAALRGLRFGIGYAASKWAVRGMTKCAALEFAPYGIRVNSIHPGVIETDMTRPALNDPAAKSRLDSIPLKRVGQPEDVARLVLFLASDESAYCTGGEFVADGGLTAE